MKENMKVTHQVTSNNRKMFSNSVIPIRSAQCVLLLEILGRWSEQSKFQISDALPQSKECEAMIPLMFDGRSVETREGSEFGSFRPLVSNSIGGYIMSYQDEIKCKNIIPFQVTFYVSFSVTMNMFQTAPSLVAWRKKYIDLFSPCISPIRKLFTREESEWLACL